MKGSIAVIVAAAAMLLVIFSINSAIMSENNTETFTKMQGYRSVAEHTEEIVRILDNATADATYNNCQSGSSIGDILADTLESYNLKAAGSVNCAFTQGPDISGSVDVSGKIKCISKIGATNASAEREFEFGKSVNDFPDCTVTDAISGCTEKPAFGGC